MLKIVFEKWGPWTDLSISEHGGTFYILQARRRSDGKLQLRVERNLWGCYGNAIVQLNDLEKVKYAGVETIK